LTWWPHKGHANSIWILSIVIRPDFFAIVGNYIAAVAGGGVGANGAPAYAASILD
jgi:hypothetical protein